MPAEQHRGVHGDAAARCLRGNGFWVGTRHGGETCDVRTRTATKRWSPPTSGRSPSQQTPSWRRALRSACARAERRSSGALRPVSACGISGQNGLPRPLGVPPASRRPAPEPLRACAGAGWLSRPPPAEPASAPVTTEPRPTAGSCSRPLRRGYRLHAAPSTTGRIGTARAGRYPQASSGVTADSRQTAAGLMRRQAGPTGRVRRPRSFGGTNQGPRSVDSDSRTAGGHSASATA